MFLAIFYLLPNTIVGHKSGGNVNEQTRVNQQSQGYIGKVKYKFWVPIKGDI